MRSLTSSPAAASSISHLRSTSSNRELGIKRLEVNGGGVTNAAFLRAGLIDEISVVIFPAVDGVRGSASVFDFTEDEIGTAAELRSMTLASSEVLEGGGVWLRYACRWSRCRSKPR